MVLRLLNRGWYAPWFKQHWRRLQTPIMVIGLGFVVLAGGVLGKAALTSNGDAAAVTDDSGVYVTDPSVDIPHSAANDNNTAVTLSRWAQILGIIIASAGLFMAANNLRPYLDEYPEFDLIILYSTLLLPTVAPLLIVMVGWDPLDYSLNQCYLPGQENLNSFSLFFSRLTNLQCWQMFFSAGIVRSALFALPMLAVSIAVGLWWNSRRWLIAAAIYYTLFIVLFTSVFTNPNGIATGAIGSLGYWLAQQEVKRGSQPWFYYGIVMPMYEFMPLFFTLGAVWLWSLRQRINYFVAYWSLMLLGIGIITSWVHWFYNRDFVWLGQPTTWVPAVTTAVVLLIITLALYFFLRKQFPQSWGNQTSLGTLLREARLVEFFPFLVWWFVISIVAYSYAGEKMPWLSTHLIIPAILMMGYFFQQLLHGISGREFFHRTNLVYLLLATLTLIAVSFLFRSLWLGEVQFGMPEFGALQRTNHFLAMLLVTAVLIAALYWWGERVSQKARRIYWVFALLGLLTLFTVRTGYMANFPNADYVTEYLVYAHGGPATKSQILAQLETISERLYGDKSIKVVYDNASSWPYTWYLREYPNRQYVGENITPSVTDAPVLIIGNDNWGKVDPFARNQYTAQTYTYLWWPMEDYRQISWDALLGDPNSPDGIRKGLGNADVRRALWDILVYRDYTKYGQVYGKEFALGQWPLRDEVRIYVRNDVMNMLWDYGVNATAVTPTVDPYAEGQLEPSVLDVIGVGELLMPRNTAVGPDGRLYVADSGNHRIVVFDGNEAVLRFGEFGDQQGQFNEPWGIAVDDAYIYVADTWNHRIQKFTLDGEFVLSFGQSGIAETPESAPSFFFGPRAITLLDNNQLAVTDTGNHRLQIFDREGNFVLATGGIGSNPGQFYEPVGIAASPLGDGAIFVADTWNQRVQELNSTINFLPVAEWMVLAWQSQSIDNKPYLAMDSAGRIYATDPEGYRVLIFDRNGAYVGRFGQFGQGGAGFDRPTGIAVAEKYPHPSPLPEGEGDNVRNLRGPPLPLGEGLGVRVF
jgi:sugar lactone lactonase YvrE